MAAEVTVREEPLKATDGVTMSREEVEAQGEAARQALTEVDPNAYGTCIDERPRKGVVSGEETGPRFSAPGGPDIYGLYIAELTGLFAGGQETGEQRLAQVKGMINGANIPSGGHEGCAANKSLGAVIGLIGTETAETGREYAKGELGDDYDDAAYEEVLAAARAVTASGVYGDWTEEVLKQVLAGEADVAIEQLLGDHEGRTFIRTNLPGMTVDQTKLHEITGGEDSFVNDDDYEDRIDAVITAVPEAEWKAKVARHAREALLATLYVALPNPELHQINVDRFTLAV